MYNRYMNGEDIGSFFAPVEGDMTSPTQTVFKNAENDRDPEKPCFGQTAHPAGSGGLFSGLSGLLSNRISKFRLDRDMITLLIVSYFLLYDCEDKNSLMLICALLIFMGI